jgi:hypothetical protein
MSAPQVIDLATRIQRRRDFAAHLSGFAAGGLVLSVLFGLGVGPAGLFVAGLLAWSTALSFQHFGQVLRGPVNASDVAAERARLEGALH